MPPVRVVVSIATSGRRYAAEAGWCRHHRAATASLVDTAARMPPVCVVVVFATSVRCHEEAGWYHAFDYSRRHISSNSSSITTVEVKNLMRSVPLRLPDIGAVP